MIAAMPMTQQKSAKGGGTWFEAMAQAWGNALDKQADAIQAKSDLVAGGDDRPGTITELTAESMKMGFLANSSHTAISSVSQGLETMARKQ